MERRKFFKWLSAGIGGCFFTPFLKENKHNLSKTKKNVVSKWFLQGDLCKRDPNILLTSFEASRNKMKNLDLSDCDVHVVFTKKDLEIEKQFLTCHYNMVGEYENYQ